MLAFLQVYRQELTFYRAPGIRHRCGRPGNWQDRRHSLNPVSGDSGRPTMRSNLTTRRRHSRHWATGYREIRSGQDPDLEVRHPREAFWASSTIVPITTPSARVEAGIDFDALDEGSIQFQDDTYTLTLPAAIITI